MKISVIIPTRNRFKYINLLIDDLLKQTVGEFEIIVVDQSSVRKNILNCIYVHTDTLGPCISRNIGAKKATGEILVFLDDDSRINSNFIEELTLPIISQNYDAVAGAICDPEGNYLLSNEEFLTKNNSNFIKVITNNPDSGHSRITMSFPAGCSAIKASVFKRIGGFDETFDPTGAGEDREIAVNLFKNGYSIWYNSNAKLLHSNAIDGGSRNLGSRSLMLDAHTYKICKKHFSEELASVLRKNIISKYRSNFINAIVKWQLIRTRYVLYRDIKKLLIEDKQL